MPIVNTKEMFKKAYEGGYAIGAFNVNNMEIIQGITEGAKLENAPLILQVSAGARKYAKHVYLMKMIEAAVACLYGTAPCDTAVAGFCRAHSVPCAEETAVPELNHAGIAAGRGNADDGVMGGENLIFHDDTSTECEI